MSRQKITGLRYSSDNWFTCIDTVVLADQELSPTAKCVYAVLCGLAGFGRRSCSPSDGKIAVTACMPVSEVREAYQELEARGVIARDGNFIQLIGHNAPCYRKEGAL